MNVLAELRHRFTCPLADRVPDSAQVRPLLAMLRPAQDAKFGDYQANFAMSLGKQLGQNPREVAAHIAH